MYEPIYLKQFCLKCLHVDKSRGRELEIHFWNMKRNHLSGRIGFIFLSFLYTSILFKYATPKRYYLHKFIKRKKRERKNSAKQQARVIKRILADAFSDLGPLPEMRTWGHWISPFRTLDPKSCTREGFLNLNTADILGERVLGCSSCAL